MEGNNASQAKFKSPINTRDWLSANNLGNLTNEFLSKNVNIESLMKMNDDQMNEYLTKFTISDKDKIRLRSKLHHLRLITQYGHSRPGSYNPETRSIRTQNAPKLYSRNHVKSLTDILNHKDEHLLDKLVNHQNIIQKLITYCLNSSNLFTQNLETSLVLVENEFKNIINTVNNKKIEIISQLNKIQARKCNEINKYALQLKEYQKKSFSTMNSCMQLLNGQENKTFEIQTMVHNLLNHQNIPSDPSQLNINCNIDVGFNYQSQIPQFLSSICTVNEKPTEQKEKLPIIEDLKVTDITVTTAVLKWNGMLSAAENDEKHNNYGWYIDLNISDMDYETKHKGAVNYVLKKKFKFQKKNSIYSINLAGLRSNNNYKVILNINDGNHKCCKKFFQQFKTKKRQKGFAFNIPKKFISEKNVNRFLVTNNGKTVLLNQYDSGTIVYGMFLNCNDNESEWAFNSVTMKLINTSPSGFGVGFATNEFNEFDGWNTGQNGSVIVYGNGEFYTSREFMTDNSQYNGKHGTKLFQLDFMRRNDTITVIVNYKLKKLQIINVTQNDKLELNLNTKDIEKIAIILWFGWTNGQSVTISNQKFM